MVSSPDYFFEAGNHPPGRTFSQADATAAAQRSRSRDERLGIDDGKSG
jgi:hypothetical protein